MKFAVGYQLPDEEGESFVDIVRDYREHIAEIYFPWGDMPSGRAPLASRRGYTDWQAQGIQEAELVELRRLGVAMDLLLNGNCYGRYAASQFLENQVTSVLDHLGERLGGIETVTTTSPAVARTIKRSFPAIEVRASVNMRIGTIHGMEYVADLFDGYHVQREFNRDLAWLADLRTWAAAHGKRLYLLANSGCLAYCSGQTFHDNMVAHEQEIDETQNIRDWTPHVCWNHLQDPAHWVSVLQSTWIRPEDLAAYEEHFPIVKLATRMHARPRAVVRAYAERRYAGNLLDLFEPGFGPAFAPCVVDNARFPADWFERTSTCGRRCQGCTYCAGVLEHVLTRLEMS